MIERYSRKEMEKLWTLESKFDFYLKVELAVCEAYCKLGHFKKEDLKKIKSKAKFDLNNIHNIEKEVKHDVIAFLTDVNSSLGDLAKYMHVGLTSSDVIDTAFALQIQAAGKIIKKDLENVKNELKALAIKHKNTVCIGRSHGVHAEVMTFGLKMLNWFDIIERNTKNFDYALKQICVGQISGPIGTYSNVPPEIESITCHLLGLKPAKISTQIIARDLHASFIHALSMIASVIEQFATEIRHLQRTEVLEIEEGFGKEQKGSSAMPHKKNPILSENLCGLSRVVKAASITAMENINLWHERDISHSSAERIIFPDCTILVDFMLNRFLGLLKNLVVHEKNMLKNVNASGGIVFSQKILLLLIEKGLSREDAYSHVQSAALKAFECNESFRMNLWLDEKVKSLVSFDELESCFDTDEYLKNIDTIYKRFGL